jgi:hypothetical protein
MNLLKWTPYLLATMALFSTGGCSGCCCGPTYIHHEGTRYSGGRGCMGRTAAQPEPPPSNNGCGSGDTGFGGSSWSGSGGGGSTSFFTSGQGGSGLSGVGGAGGIGGSGLGGAGGAHAGGADAGAGLGGMMGAGGMAPDAGPQDAGTD